MGFQEGGDGLGVSSSVQPMARWVGLYVGMSISPGSTSTGTAMSGRPVGCCDQPVAHWVGVYVGTSISPGSTSTGTAMSGRPVGCCDGGIWGGVTG